MTNRVFITIAISSLICLHAGLSLAQETASTEAVLQRSYELLGDYPTDAQPGQSIAVADQTGALSNEEWRIAHSRKAYEWHHTASILIFFVVVALVGAGVTLAALQLRSWLKRAAKYDEVILNALTGKSDNIADATSLLAALAEPDGGKLNISGKSLALSSPYVGVIILGLSLAFFLAYLIVVYPLTVGPSS